MVIKMHLKWSRYILSLRQQNMEGPIALADKMEGLLALVLEWRDETALQLSLAPTNVISDHLAKCIAYTKCRTVEDLEGVGVRIVGVQGLATRINEYLISHLDASTSESGSANSVPNNGSEDLNAFNNQLIAMPDESWQPLSAWPHAVFKPGKGA